MKLHLKFGFFLIFFLLETIATSEKFDSKSEWLEKLEKLEKLADFHGVKKSDFSLNRATGTNDFEINLQCSPEPTSVHRLRPSDIDVIGAMGDSLTAGNGAEGETIFDIFTENRGISWTVGGEESLETVLTITNILRKFNPALKGYSVGERNDPDRDWWFNVAVPGARARNMPDQARTLIDYMKNDSRINYENDWKLVSIFIGGNDLCALNRSEDATPEAYTGYLKEALDILHSELPRTFINLVDILEIYLLPDIGTGFGSTPVCRIAQQLFCGYVVSANEEEQAFIRQQNKLYQTLTEELINSRRYDTRDDFTVVIQPFFRDTILPTTETGEVDSTYFGPDCFHFSGKGHAMGAMNIWNNMFEPVGMKSTQWSISDLKCPTKDSPYIFTHLNSDIDEGSAMSTVEITSIHPETTATITSTKATTPSKTTPSKTTPRKTTPSKTSPPKTTTTSDCRCTPTNEADEWMIAVISVFAVFVASEALILLCLFKKSKTGNNYSMEMYKVDTK